MATDWGGALNAQVLSCESSQVWKTSSDLAPRPPPVPPLSWRYRNSESITRSNVPCGMCHGTHHPAKVAQRAHTHRERLRDLEQELFRPKHPKKQIGWDFRKIGYDNPLTTRSSYALLTHRRAPRVTQAEEPPSFDHFKPLPPIEADLNQPCCNHLEDSSSSDDDGEPTGETRNDPEDSRQAFLELVRDADAFSGCADPELDRKTPQGRHRFHQRCTQDALLPLAAVATSHKPAGVELPCYMVGQQLVSALAESLDVNKVPIQRVNLAGNRLNPASCEQFLKKLTLKTEYVTCALNSITTLNLSNNTLGKQGCGVLSQILHTSNALKHLSLASCELGDALGTELIEAIGVSRLLSCDLSDNHLQNVTAVSLGCMLASSQQSLLALKLSYNRIRCEGAVALVEGLVTNKSLTDLDLSWNSFGGMQAPEELAEETDDDSDDSENADEGALQKFYREPFEDETCPFLGVGALKQLVEENTTLLCIDLSHNNLSSAEGAMLLSSVASSNTNLRRLVIDHNQLGPASLPALLHCFRLNSKCFISAKGCDFTVDVPGGCGGRTSQWSAAVTPFHHQWGGYHPSPDPIL